jgi:hypothetical protein
MLLGLFVRGLALLCTDQLSHLVVARSDDGFGRMSGTDIVVLVPFLTRDSVALVDLLDGLAGISNVHVLGLVTIGLGVDVVNHISGHHLVVRLGGCIQASIFE